MISIREVPTSLHGLGDFNEAVAGIVAGGELSKVVSAISSVQNELISAINAKGAVLDGYQKAEALFYEMASQDTGEMGPFIAALEGARMGVQLFARQVQTLTELEIALSKVSVALYSAGLTSDSNSIDQTVAQIRRFVTETDGAFSQISEYRSTKLAIISAFASQLSAYGIGRSDYSNPQRFVAFGEAVRAVAPIPDEPPVPSEIDRGLGALPLLAVGLLYALAIVAATVVAIVSVKSIISALNSKADTTKALLLQRSSEKETLRAQLYAQGASPETIRTAMATFDEDTEGMRKKIPDSGLLSELMMPIAAALAILYGLKKAGIL